MGLLLVGDPGGTLVQTTAWAATKRALGQQTQLTVVRDEAGQLAGGALLVARRVAPGTSVGYIAGGPVVVGDDLGLLNLTLRAAVRHARRLGVCLLIVQLPEGSSHRLETLATVGFAVGPLAVAPEATIRLDVSRRDEVLLGRMRKSLRRSLRRSWQEGLEVFESDDIEQFHRLHIAAAQRHGFTPRTLGYLQSQWEALRPRGYVAMLLGRHDGNVVAGLWLTRFGDTVTSRLHGWDATLPAPRHVNEALDWGAISWARATGATVYDLGGFDRDSAVRLCAGLPMDHAFAKSSNFFKLGYEAIPTLLPRAQFLVLNRVVRQAGRVLLPRLLSSGIASGMAATLRNG